MKANYYSIIFLQDSSADEALAILDESGEQAAMDHLAQWDMGGESEHCMSSYTEKPWGSEDTLYRKGYYILSYNSILGCIGLTRKRRGVIPAEFR